ncbi:MAG TPA: sialidase family protein [Candidatus Dormibacteraeota bacterium]|nr:sialidase family protein [Candidatus Dormibacteraeota bacterium]
MTKKVLWAVALAGALALMGAPAGVAGGGPVLVSGPSNSTCTAAQDLSQPGSVFPNSVVEPSASVHGKHVIAMWHQDRWSNGGGHGIGVNTSSDGGASWGTSSAMPWDGCEANTPSPSLTQYFRNSDPWVSFGPDGTAYASALAFNILVPNWANAVAVATSTDSGKTWGNVMPIPGSEFKLFSQGTDKNSTTADPNIAGTAYTVWDTLFEPTDNPDDNPHTSSYTGPAYFSKTTDGGKTWSQAKIIINTNQRQQTIGNIIVVDPLSGALYDFTDLLISPNTSLGQGTNGNAQVAFVKSTDGGDHWTQPQIIAPFDSLGVFDPNTGAPLRVGNGLEEVAIDPATGKLYVTWERSSNFEKNTKQSSTFWDDQIVLDTSSDGGVSWSGPTVIHTFNGAPTYTPMVAVSGDKVAVTYYDNRNLPSGDISNLPTDYWASVSTKGGAFVEQHLAGPFDEMSAPVARGFFLGDYEALQASGAGFIAVFVTTNCASPYTGSNCGPASSNRSPNTKNTNPTSTFAASF